MVDSPPADLRRVVPRPVRILDHAISEARAAFLWYRQRSTVAAERFRDEFDCAIEAIGDSPETWPAYVEGTRRYLFRRFPFFVVYRVKRDEIEVVAIVHARRRPGYWKDR